MRILSGRNLQRATSWTASRGRERSTGLRSATCRLCALKMAGSATWRRLPTGRTRSMDSSPRTSSSPPSRRRIGSVNSTSTCWKRSAAGCSVRWKQERPRFPSVSTSVRRTLSRKERWRRPWGFWRRTAFRSPPLCCSLNVFGTYHFDLIKLDMVFISGLAGKEAMGQTEGSSERFWTVLLIPASTPSQRVWKQRDSLPFLPRQAASCSRAITSESPFPGRAALKRRPFASGDNGDRETSVAIATAIL